MKILQNSGEPIYQQIADQFRTDILAGKFKQGEYLPMLRVACRKKSYKYYLS